MSNMKMSNILFYGGILVFLYYMYLPGFKLPENIIAEPDLVEVVRDANCLVFCIPHQVCSTLLDLL